MNIVHPELAFDKNSAFIASYFDANHKELDYSEFAALLNVKGHLSYQSDLITNGNPNRVFKMRCCDKNLLDLTKETAPLRLR